MQILRRTVWALALLLTLLAAGCASTADTENLSSRPWNYPRGSWQGSMPGMTPPGR